MGQKRKKHATKKRVGGFKTSSLTNPENPIVKYGSMALGYLFGDKINAQIDKITGAKIDTKIVAAGEIGIGSLFVFKKGKKNIITTVAGGVLIGAGLKRGLAAFGLGGFQDVKYVNGYQDVKYINGRRMNGKVGWNPGNGGMEMGGDVKVPVTQRSSVNGMLSGMGSKAA